MAGGGDAGERPDALLRRHAVALEAAGTHAAAHAAAHHHGHAAAIERHIELERVGDVELAGSGLSGSGLGSGKRRCTHRRAGVIDQLADFQFAAAQIVDQ